MEGLEQLTDMGIELKAGVAAIFLLVHGVAHFKGWYYSVPSVDMLTHFLGGLVVGALLKDFELAIALIIGWELVEALLVKKNRKVFKEKPFNKLRDLFFGVFGYVFGFDFL